MIYAEDTKRRMDAILKAFHAYIQGQDYFDIVFSEKIGYVMILVKNPEDAGAVSLDTPEKLLDVLFNEIINDVVNAPENKSHIADARTLSKYEEAESRRQIEAILETITDGKEQYFDYLDSYLKAYQENYCED